MATLTYTSFGQASPDGLMAMIPHIQSSHNDTCIPLDNNLVDISGCAIDEVEIESGNLAPYRVSPITPTKERNRRATMPETLKHRPREIQLTGIFSPPQTPTSRDPMSKNEGKHFEIERPETPPPSTHRLNFPGSPQTPTHPPLQDDSNEALDDRNEIEAPATPVLYNLIRNDGPPKFVMAPTSAPSTVNENVPESEECEPFDREAIRGHPSACLFVASLNSQKTEEQLRQSVTCLFSKWGTLLNVKVLKDWANRPFSFVQYTTAQEASYALSKCQKACLDGRMIRVERARVNRTLYVTKDKGKLDEAAIKALLEPFGQIEEIVIPGSWKRASKEFRKGCFARFVFRDDAINAYQTLRNSDTYTIEWAQNLDRSLTPPPLGATQKVPIDYTSIFIGQLDRSVDEKAIRERFGRYGTIVGIQLLVKPSIPGRRQGEDYGTGFAFVKFDGRESATKAVKAENGASFQGRTIRVQYRELHQRINHSQPPITTRNPTTLIPKLAPAPTSPHRPPPLTPPKSLSQLSGTSGLSPDTHSLGTYTSFDPVTGLATTSVQHTPPHRRILNPLAPPFMFLHPLQVYPVKPEQMYPAVKHEGWTTEHPVTGIPPGAGPFPSLPPAPADFASPIPLGGMVVQGVFGFPGGTPGEMGAVPICWDPSVGMFRALSESESAGS